jgi:hypothetical protein
MNILELTPALRLSSNVTRGYAQATFALERTLSP